MTREFSRRILKDKSDAYLLKQLNVLLQKLKIERIPHATGMTIVTPDQSLKRAGTIFPL